MKKLLSLLLFGSATVCQSTILKQTKIIYDSYKTLSKSLVHKDYRLDTGDMDKIVETIDAQLKCYHKIVAEQSPLQEYCNRDQDEMYIMNNIFRLIIDKCRTNYISAESAIKLFNTMHYIFKNSNKTDLLKTAFVNNTESLIENLYYPKDRDCLQEAVFEAVKTDPTLTSAIHKLVRGTLEEGVRISCPKWYFSK